MNKKIKFRGKPKRGYNYGKEWLYGSLVDLGDNNYGIIEPEDFGYTDNGEYDYSHTPVQTDTVCQFTGLLDKNGIEIYENDVVKTTVEGKSFETIVTWGKQSHGWSLKCDRTDEHFGTVKYYKLPPSHKIEVIGNVFSENWQKGLDILLNR